MSMRISFELDESDLKHFQLIMKEARKASKRIAPEDIVAAAEGLLTDVAATKAPGFIVERLTKLRLMIDMLSDLDWRLPHQEAAIMIELVVRELKHEIEAYQGFCDYRERLQQQKGPETKASRSGWLDERRKSLQSRMRRRRKDRPGLLR